MHVVRGITIWAMAVAAMLWSAAAVAHEQPNIVLIFADDLGYGDLGCYGGEVIKTPNIDRLCEEGMKFTDFYAGATVCAPSRCVLMTGYHTGHCRVRGNGDPTRQSLLDEDLTIAEVLQEAGYRTGCIGKWALGDQRGGEAGFPGRQGWDYFYGYLNQGHAHNYYPEFLWRSEGQSDPVKVALRNEMDREGTYAMNEVGAGVARVKIDYSHDLCAQEALDFLERNKDRRFFLYLPFTLPHANNEANRRVGNGAEVPDLGIYADKDWPEQDKGHAAMITLLDTDVGRIMDRLAEYGLDENTLVLFTSDNGPHHESGQNLDRFQPWGAVRGTKRDLYDGGIRVPMIARWKGHVDAGAVSHHIGYFGDLFATFCDLAKVPTPPGLDSISIVPTLAGRPEQQKQHDYLYWEFYEQGSKQAVRAGKWKAVRKPMFDGSIELYNLDEDLKERNDVAADHPQVVSRMQSLMEEAHVPSDRWSVRGNRKK